MAATRDPVARASTLASRLAAALGDGLESVLLYGSAARGDYVADRSDINVLVLVRDASPGALRPAGEALAEWVRAGETPPLVLSDDEWRRSSDVFAMEIEDMRGGHRVLHGQDPLDGVTTTRDDLRRELEREVVGTLLHLRAAHAAAATEAKALEALLTSSVGQVMTLCRGLLRLHGEEPTADRAALVARAAALAGFESDGLEWAVATVGGRRPRPLASHDVLAGAYLAAVERLARHVDDFATEDS